MIILDNKENKYSLQLLSGHSRDNYPARHSTVQVTNTKVVVSVPILPADPHSRDKRFVSVVSLVVTFFPIERNSTLHTPDEELYALINI